MEKIPSLLIIYPYGNIDTNPTICLLLEELSRRKVDVDVLLAGSKKFFAPETYGKSVSFNFLAPSFFSAEQPLSIRVGRAFAAFQGEWKSIAVDLFPRLISGILKPKYQAIIGVDPTGIVIASRLNVFRVPLIYISFELMFPEELSGKDVDLHAKEKAACAGVKLALIQDSVRAALLSQNTGIPSERIFIVPAAPARTEIAQPHDLRQRFNIARQQRIVLYSGSIVQWAGAFDFEEMIACWPEKFCLVIHTRNYLEPSYLCYLETLKKTGRIFYTNEPVPRHELPSLVAGADIGLVIYKPGPMQWTTGKNIYHIGHASGKVSYYAMCGLPMLARKLPVFEKDFANYSCGMTYDYLSETGRMLVEIDKEYQTFRGGALRFYDEVLEPTKRMQAFVEKLITLH
jgi:hypothetical protein